MFDVSVIKCDSYNSDEVKSALSAAIEAVGGLSWVKEGTIIAIKANNKVCKILFIVYSLFDY